MARRRLQRQPRRPPSSAKRTIPWLLLLALSLPIAFWLGRKTAEAPPPISEPIASQAPIAPEPAALTTCTSTAGLCPCPVKRIAKKKPIVVLPIPKKQTPPRETSPFDRDPTEPTASYLRAHASDLSACAPKIGARLRVHLEVQVAPTGAIEKVRLTNLEPLPGEVASCVDRSVRALSPPGFDGSSSEVFALTVVL